MYACFGWSDFMAQCTTSIQWLNKSVMAPPPKFQYQRQWLNFQRLRVDRFGRPVTLIILPPIGSDLRDSSQAAPLNQLDGILKVCPATLLHAALQNLLTGTNRACQGGSFLDGVSDRFFQINVFAGRERIDRHANVPVVWRCDEHGINVFPQYLAIIQVGSRNAIGPFFDNVPMRRIDITHSHNLVWTNLLSRIKQVSHPAPRSDNSDADSIVRTKYSG